MDDIHEIFTEELGVGFGCQQATVQVLNKYKDKLPNLLLDHWEKYGWCGYADGLLWVVNPEDYADILHMWMGRHPLWSKDKYHVIARTAFGELMVWSEKRGYFVDIQPLNNWILPDPYASDTDLTDKDLELDIESFFIGVEKESFDKSDENGNRLFDHALKKLGRLKHDEMYGLKLAPVLGGATTMDNLQIVKIREHLMILADMADPETVDVSNY